MKRIIAVLRAAVLLFALAACSATQSTSQAPAAAPVQSAADPTATKPISAPSVAALAGKIAPSAADAGWDVTTAVPIALEGGSIRASGEGVAVDGSVATIGAAGTYRLSGALDYDGGFKISGGLLVAAGSAGMAQAPGGGSTQNSLLINYSASQPAGSVVHIHDSAGQEILTFAPGKSYQSLAFSSPDLAQGATYEITSGGSAAGASVAGLYQDGAYSGGAAYASFTVESTLTQVGASARRMR